MIVGKYCHGLPAGPLIDWTTASHRMTFSWLTETVRVPGPASAASGLRLSKLWPDDSVYGPSCSSPERMRTAPSTKPSASGVGGGASVHVPVAALPTSALSSQSGAPCNTSTTDCVQSGAPGPAMSAHRHGGAGRLAGAGELDRVENAQVFERERLSERVEEEAQVDGVVIVKIGVVALE